MDVDDEPVASSGMGIEGSTRRGDDAIDVRVSFHGTPPRQSISVDVLFRSLAEELCPSS